MPWTFVHPAAVLPLRKYFANRHLFGAVVVGSISPDFGYYVGRFDMATTAHTLLGLLISLFAYWPGAVGTYSDTA